MSEDRLDAFERQATELVAAAKGLLNEFESRLGEVVSGQRVAESELRAESTRITHHLQELANRARDLANDQRALLTRIERDWQLKIEENATRAGERQAQAFGQSIAAGLEKRLARLAGEVERATRRLSWKVTLGWALGLAIGIPLAINVGIEAFAPSVADQSIPGLTVAQTHEVLSRIELCWPKPTHFSDVHVCVATDDPPRLTRGPHEEAAAIARGM